MLGLLILPLIEMTKQVYINIKELVQVRPLPVTPLTGTEFQHVPSMLNAFLVIENNTVVDFGNMESFDPAFYPTHDLIDMLGRFVLPAFCDSHTHAVFARPRETEFVDKIKGLSYQEIAAKGGGILNSARHVQALSEDELFEISLPRVQELIAAGTGALEIKSGYGLTLSDELKMLRVIKRIKAHLDIPIKTTFLAAHALPEEYKSNKQGFIQAVVNQWIPNVISEVLADYIDLFCETGYFDAVDIELIAQAIQGSHLKLKVHVNQFNALGGIETAIKNNAVSVDHLEVMNPEDFHNLEKSNTIATALPSCSFFLSIPYAPLKDMISKNIAIALASDYNPGSTPSGNMNFVISLACTKQKLTPEQAFNAATINGAFAMEVSNEVGSITIGKKANLIITKKISSYSMIPYAFGSNLIDEVYINGKAILGS